MQRVLRRIAWVLLGVATTAYSSTSLFEESTASAINDQTAATTIAEAPGTYAAAEIPGAVLNHELSKAPIPLSAPSAVGPKSDAGSNRMDAKLPPVQAAVAPDLTPAPFMPPEAQAALNFADQAVKALEAEAAGLENAVTWRTASLTEDALGGRSKKRRYRAY